MHYNFMKVDSANLDSKSDGLELPTLPCHWDIVVILSISYGTLAKENPCGRRRRRCRCAKAKCENDNKYKADSTTFHVNLLFSNW